MNLDIDFHIEQELQSKLMDLSQDKIKNIKDFILSSIFWTLTNDMNLHRLSFNILCSVMYRSANIKLYAELVYDLINANSQIGAKFHHFLIKSLLHSISQEIIYPYRISHFTFLYFLYKLNLIDITLIINMFPESIENTLSEKEMIIFAYFSQFIKIESKSLFDSVKLYFVTFKENIPIYLKDFTDNFLNENFSIDAEIFESETLRNFLKNDDIENLKKVASDPEFDYNQKLPPSIYEPSLILQNYPPLLHFTAFYNSVRCFNFLLMMGADQNLNDNSKKSLPLFAVASGCIEIIRTIEQRQLPFDGSLQIASLFHRNDILCWLHEGLFEKVSLSSYSSGRKTVLNEASISNNLFAVDLCVKHKVKINQKNARKSTALHLAAAYNNYDVIQLLLGLNHPKLDPNIVNMSGLTPLMVAIQRENVESVKTFIEFLNKDVKNLNVIKIDFEKKSENNESDFPIHIAAKTGNAEIFDLILKNTLNVNVQQKYGYTALHIAASMRHAAVVEAIIADKRVDVNVQDSAGWAPLHLAAQFGFSDIVRMLVRLGERIDMKLKTHDGKTALDLAMNEDRKEVVDLISSS